MNRLVDQATASLPFGVTLKLFVGDFRVRIMLQPPSAVLLDGYFVGIK